MRTKEKQPVPRTVIDKSFKSDVLLNPEPVLVVLWASSCMPFQHGKVAKTILGITSKRALEAELADYLTGRPIKPTNEVNA